MRTGPSNMSVMSSPTSCLSAWMYSTAALQFKLLLIRHGAKFRKSVRMPHLSVSTLLVLFLRWGMWSRRTVKLVLTCFTRFLSRAFLKLL